MFSKLTTYFHILVSVTLKQSLFSNLLYIPSVICLESLFDLLIKKTQNKKFLVRSRTKSCFHCVHHSLQIVINHYLKHSQNKKASNKETSRQISLQLLQNNLSFIFISISELNHSEYPPELDDIDKGISRGIYRNLLPID